MVLAASPSDTGPSTLTAALWALRGNPARGLVFVSASAPDRQLTFGQLLDACRETARGLHASGLRRGQRVGILVSNPQSFIETFLGAVLLGALPVPLATSNPSLRGDQHIALATRILAVAEADALVTTEHEAMDLRVLLADSGINVIALEALAVQGAQEPPYYAPEPSDACFLQFTSGSTSHPKAVVVTHGNLAANARCIMRHGLRVDPARDLVVTWLPLYHDMGLIGNVLSPLFWNLPVAHIGTASFVRRPAIWLTTIDRLRATITFAPNFALSLVTKRCGQMPQRLDLSCLRVVGCGAEPIDPDVLQSFATTFEVHGLNVNAIMPCYGMAECTLAVSFADLELRWRSVRKHASAVGGWNEFVSCGEPFPDHEAVVLSTKGDSLPPGQCGMIAVRGPSVSPGYYRNPAATAASFRDGWLLTGDYGFLDGGQLFVVGRIRDLITIQDSIFYPHFIERAVQGVAGVRENCVVAFASQVNNAECVVIVAEVQTALPLDVLSSQVQACVAALTGSAQLVFVAIRPGTLPKTSSGKVRRAITRTRWQNNELSSLVPASSRGTGAEAATASL